MKNVYIIGGIIILIVGALYFMTSQPDENKRENGEENSVLSNIVPLSGVAGETAPAQNDAQKEEKGIAVMSTSLGDITIQLNAADAPNTVSNFITLAKKGFYDGTKFHRVIPNFMVQGGDPLTKDDSLKGQWGTGGPGYAFADEIHANNNNVIGSISMANSGPDTNGSQFFLNVANNNFLDDKHTVFGVVIQGMDVVNAIVQAPTEGSDRPIEAIVINSVTIK